MEEYEIDRSSHSLMLSRIASKPALVRAWRKVRANRGAAGIDAVSLQQFERRLDPNLTELSRNLLNRTYEPLPSRYVRIPKADGKYRELAIPAVRDRVAQRAVLDAVEPLFEPQFLDSSFAFRQGRSVEMAVQRIVVARAQGCWWTVESDVSNFFPEIDHQLLIESIRQTVADEDLLRLIVLWLDAGALDGARPKPHWTARWRDSLAGAQMAARDALHNAVDDYLSFKLGDDGYGEYVAGEEFDAAADDAESRADDGARRSGPGRAAWRRLAQDGLLLALANRGLLRSVVSAKVLGIGGAAIALAAMTPMALKKLREMAERDAGALQGAPISPLLSNIHLHPFDQAASREGFRLVRYCDDFVIPCRSQSEARAALESAEESLRRRRLRLNAEKTRIVSPDEPFEFLSYRFEPDGRVIAPPNIHEVIARRVAAFAERAMSRAADRAKITGRKTESFLSELKGRWFK